MQRAFGTGAATNSVVDLKYTDCIMVIGANPTDAHPVTGAKLKQHALKAKPPLLLTRGAPNWRVMPPITCSLRPGTNVALLNMMLYYIMLDKMEDKAIHRSQNRRLRRHLRIRFLR
jgi:formate dehydrogenase major subunit